MMSLFFALVFALAVHACAPAHGKHPESTHRHGPTVPVERLWAFFDFPCAQGFQWRSGWWFGTFFIFPYIGNNYPNWLIFFRGVETTNQRYVGLSQHFRLHMIQLQTLPQALGWSGGGIHPFPSSTWALWWALRQMGPDDQRMISI